MGATRGGGTNLQHWVRPHASQQGLLRSSRCGVWLDTWDPGSLRTWGGCSALGPCPTFGPSPEGNPIDGPSLPPSSVVGPFGRFGGGPVSLIWGLRAQEPWSFLPRHLAPLPSSWEKEGRVLSVATMAVAGVGPKAGGTYGGQEDSLGPQLALERSLLVSNFSPCVSLTPGLFRNPPSTTQPAPTQ